MDFFALIAFLALYYLRPQEWFASFNALHPVQLLAVLAFWALFQSHKLKLRTLVRTPLDWLVVFYFIATYISGLQFSLGSNEAVMMFYFVAVCSLDSIRRQEIFLYWWCAFILIIVLLALGTTVGFDPFGSMDKTEGVMKGRLILNLSIFNNPNCLAHSIVPVLPMVYYLFFWRRMVMKAGVLLLVIPLYCIFLTQSKGAFLCCFATLLATLTFGRSVLYQCLIVVVALLFGYGALFALPRMNELKNTKTDPAIQGRVAALTFGLHLMQTNFFGVGARNFEDAFLRYGPLEKHVTVRVLPAREISGGPNRPPRTIDARVLRIVRWTHFSKAPHNAYNENGAEFGYPGLFIFIGILYCCLRTLLLVKSDNDDEERIRRVLFAMVVAYAVSSWMVDFCYRPTFFMLIATISAFHRRLIDNQNAPETAVAKPLLAQRPWLRNLPGFKLPEIPVPALAAPLPAGSVACVAQEAAPGPIVLRPSGVPASPLLPRRALAWHKPDSTIEEKLRKNFIWTRLGIWDFLITLALTYAAVVFWKHLISTM